MRPRIRTLVAPLAALALASGLAAAQAPPPTLVDLELSLLVDVSGSVSTGEFNLQKQGYVNAFNDASLWDRIQAGRHGRIAVNYIYWSSATNQQLAVDWMLIDSYASSQMFAGMIDGTTRPFSGGTEPGAAISYATPLFFSNMFQGDRLVIDVSGDGCGNTARTQSARDAALAAGVTTINGIVIGGGASIRNCYERDVIGGEGAFVEVAMDFDEFDEALRRKLEREIAPSVVPEPGTVVLMATGLVGVLGVGVFRRRRES